MDASGFIANFLTTLIGGVFVAWLFAPTDVAGQALRRLRIMGSYLYRALGLLGACGMLVSNAYEFYKFAYSDTPIQRLEIIGLFFYMLNFFLYLVVTVVIISIWIKGDRLSPKVRP
jgi:hypothetical protein